MDTRVIGEVLRACRTSMDKTLEQAARELNIGTSLLGMYERGERVPPPDKLALLADYYGISVDALLGRTAAQSHTEERVPTQEAQALWKRLGGRVHEYRRRQKISLEDLAEQAGIDPQQLIRIEAGLVDTPLPSLLALASSLGVRLNDLLPNDVSTASKRSLEAAAVFFRDRGLTDEEIQKILDYIRLVEKARDSRNRNEQ